MIIGIVSYNIIKVTFSQLDIGIIFHTYYYILKKKAVQVTIHGGYFSFKIARLVYLQRGRERAGRKKKGGCVSADRGGKERRAKVCKQRRCVHGRLHPHYFRPKKFFPICLWNQLPVKSLLLSTLLPQRAHLPSRLDLESREKLWENSDRLPFSLCTWENLSACRQTDQPIFNLLSSHPWNASSSAEKSLPSCLFDGVQSNPEVFIFCIWKSSPPEG